MVGASRGTCRVALGLLLFWLAVLLYMSSTLYTNDAAGERTERQLAKALHELDALKQQNDQLRSLAEQLKDIRSLADTAPRDGDAAVVSADIVRQLQEANIKIRALEQQQGAGAVAVGTEKGGLDGEHEEIRRKVETGVTEMWYYVQHQLAQLSSDPGLSPRLNSVIGNTVDHYRVIMTDLYNLSQSNGAGYWRKQEAHALEQTVQQRLHALQNPSDCSTARKVVCNLNKGCGYGCQLHHVVYCFIIAYGTERTLVLESRGWRYAPSGWDTFFQPLSETCTDRGGSSARSWGPPSVIDNVQVVELPIVDSLHPRPPFMPLAIPADLAPRLQSLHGHPTVWWIGQFLKYILRPQEALAQDMQETLDKLGFKSPIVGVHVRRTDKVGTEAAFHSIDEYMTHVANYYNLLERRQRVDRRRIYLATDDPNLLDEARQKFPEYDIISDNEISRTAGLGSRYSESSLRGIIMDIHFLSLSDYLVCTFSSQVCRVAYEIMQTMHPDASQSFYSLDDIYYFGGQNAHDQEVLHNHQASSSAEIDLRRGDLVGIAGNHWDGYSKGLNRRTGKSGLYPSYKVKDHVDVVDFPTYNHVKINDNR